jgi:hypothetical protein
MPNVFAIARRIVAYFAGLLPAAIDRGDYSVACGEQAAYHYDYAYGRSSKMTDWIRGFGEGLIDALVAPARRAWRQLQRRIRLGHLTDAQLEHLLQTHRQVEYDLRQAALRIVDLEQHAASISAIDRAYAVNAAGMGYVLDEIDARYHRAQAGTFASRETTNDIGELR